MRGERHPSLQRLYSFPAAGHCPQHKPIFAPRAFYKSHRLSTSHYKQEHKGEKGLGQGHQASVSRSQKWILNLVCLVLAPALGFFWLKQVVVQVFACGRCCLLVSPPLTKFLFLSEGIFPSVGNNPAL